MLHTTACKVVDDSALNALAVSSNRGDGIGLRIGTGRVGHVVVRRHDGHVVQAYLPDGSGQCVGTFVGSPDELAVSIVELMAGIVLGTLEGDGSARNSIPVIGDRRSILRKRLVVATYV